TKLPGCHATWHPGSFAVSSRTAVGGLENHRLFDGGEVDVLRANDFERAIVLELRDGVAAERRVGALDVQRTADALVVDVFTVGQQFGALGECPALGAAPLVLVCQIL